MPERPDGPSPELGTNGQIAAALDTLATRSEARDAAGRYTAGVIRTGKRTEQYWQYMAGVKAEIIASVRTQLAADGVRLTRGPDLPVHAGPVRHSGGRVATSYVKRSNGALRTPAQTTARAGKYDNKSDQ